MEEKEYCVAVPYSPLPPLSCGEDRKKRGKMQHTPYFEAELLFIDKRGNVLCFHLAGYLFSSLCGFYLYKMYIDNYVCIYKYTD